MKIENWIMLHDGMTPVLKTISDAAKKTTQSYDEAKAKVEQFNNSSLARFVNTNVSKLNTLRNAVGTFAINGAMAVDRVTHRLQRMNNQLKNSVKGTNDLGQKMSMLKSMFLGNIMSNMFFRGVEGVKSFFQGLVQLSDEYAGITQRLRLMADTQNNVNILNNDIYNSAMRARGGYLQMADAFSQIALNARSAFPDPREAIKFTEGLQKLYAISGTPKLARQFATVQLVQALGAGRLMGNDFRSIADQAPVIENYIAKTMGVTRGQLRQLSTEGKITTDIMKRAILDNFDEINKKFQSAPLTWGDRFTLFKNKAIRAFTPVLQGINKLANSPEIGHFFDMLVELAKGAAVGFYFVVKGITFVFTGIMSVMTAVYRFFQKHTGLLYTAMALLCGVLALMVTPILIQAAAWVTNSVAQGLATAAQWLLNDAMYACPLTWIVGAILLVAGAIYWLIQAYNKWTGKHISAVYFVGYTFGVLFAHCYNIMATFMNNVIAIAAFFCNVWKHPLDSLYNLFADVWDGIVDLVIESARTIADAISKIPGLQKILGGAKDKLIASHFHIQRINHDDDVFDYNKHKWGLKNSMAVGDAWGKAITSFGLPSMPKTGAWDPLNNQPLLGEENPAKNTAGNTKKIADNTKRIADKIDMTAEEIKNLKDSALQQAMQQFHEQHTVVNITNHNSVDSNVDIDGMTSNIVKGIKQAMQMRREVTA